MKTLLRLVSYAGLALSLLPALLLLAGRIELPLYYRLMTVGMVLWFGTAVFWIKADKSEG